MKPTAPPSRVQIFDYLDSRKFLSDFYQIQKNGTPSFSYAVFARRAGLASAAHLKLVMDGKRNLTEKSIPKFARGLKLGVGETEYFKNLVTFTQSHDDLEKAKALSLLRKMRLRRGLSRLNDTQQSALYEDWYFPLVYELAALQEFQSDANWVCQRLLVPITASQARRALDHLIASGLLIQKEGRWTQAQTISQSSDEIENLMIRQFQQKMLELATDRWNDPVQEREMGCLTVCLDPQDFETLKQRLKDFLVQCNLEFSGRKTNGRLYQYNFQLFRLDGDH